MSAIVLRNRQRVRRVNTPLLRRIICSLLDELAAEGNHELCVHLVAAPEMARINQQFLQHEGSTDVITFDCANYDERVLSTPTRNQPNARTDLSRPAKRGEGRGEGPLPGAPLRGEIYVCVNDAVAQAREFRTTWQSELVRYIVHGVLHLLGHDDLKSAARRKMKQEENRWLRSLTARFPLGRLSRKSGSKR